MRDQLSYHSSFLGKNKIYAQCLTVYQFMPVRVRWSYMQNTNEKIRIPLLYAVLHLFYTCLFFQRMKEGPRRNNVFGMNGLQGLKCKIVLKTPFAITPLHPVQNCALLCRWCRIHSRQSAVKVVHAIQQTTALKCTRRWHHHGKYIYRATITIIDS